MSRLHFGLIGHPLGHSLSPALHQAALTAAGLDGDYTLFPVPPGPGCEDRLQDLLGRIRRRRLDGLNVTLPYKAQIVSFLETLSPEAERLGAVNAISRSPSGLVGENTDAPAFWHDLHAEPGFLPATATCALVLGAGGAASAVAGVLAHHGWRVGIVARRASRADGLASQLRQAIPGARLSAGDLSALPRLLETLTPQLVVNATSAGMTPDLHLTPWPADLPLPSTAVVYDLVYSPPETALVERARRQGLPARGGLGMLVEQAARSFELWTGRAAERSAMGAAALNALAQGV
jgi:shikimate dehydrogenase